MTEVGAPRRLQLLIVDDHRVFAEALASRLLANEFVEDVAVAFRAGDVLPKVRAFRPDLALVDVVLGDESGIDVVKALATDFPDLPAVMVSAISDTSEVIRALSAGARGWIPKDVSIEEFLGAVDAVLMGRIWLPTRLLSDVLEGLLGQQAAAERERSFLDDLSPRQREVLAYLTQGLSRQEIAVEMGVSHNTVRTHIQTLLKKAEAHSTLALLARARHYGFSSDVPSLSR